jgi:hypothetical protein
MSYPEYRATETNLSPFFNEATERIAVLKESLLYKLIGMHALQEGRRLESLANDLCEDMSEEALGDYHLLNSKDESVEDSVTDSFAQLREADTAIDMFAMRAVGIIGGFTIRGVNVNELYLMGMLDEGDDKKYVQFSRVWTTEGSFFQNDHIEPITDAACLNEPYSPDPQEVDVDKLTPKLIPYSVVLEDLDSLSAEQIRSKIGLGDPS